MLGKWGGGRPFKNKPSIDGPCPSVATSTDRRTFLPIGIIGHAMSGHQDHVPMADPDAGYLGVPFTQKENEEEWMDMLDWAKIEAELGGSSTD